jgi:peptidyl-prolyl cis-trans isomerase SurA
MSSSRFAARTNHRHVVVLNALAAVCFAVACRPTPATPEPAVTSDTWAVVDGREITREDVEKAYRRAGPTAQTLSEEETSTAKLSLLDDLIVQDILLNKALALKIEVPESELDTAYAEAKKNIPDEAFQQELTRRSLTAADMREGLRRELLSQKLLEREVSAKIAVSDK